MPALATAGNAGNEKKSEKTTSERKNYLMSPVFNFSHLLTAEKNTNLEIRDSLLKIISKPDEG